MVKEPRTLQEATVYFADADNCIAYLVNRRWPDGTVKCPTCGRSDVTYVPARRVWQCKTRHPKCQFSVKVGTIMEDSPIGLDKWLMAMWMIANCKNGVSSWEIHRTIGVTQKTAWFMRHRIRLAMQGEHGSKLNGEVEADETFIGGKARNMHRSKWQKKMELENRGGKAIAFGLLERGGKVRTMVVNDRERATLQGRIKHHVEPGAAVLTDELHSYWGLEKEFVHQIVNHAAEYVNGRVHTNTIENFWSCLKRGLGGTYIAVEPFHLFRYLDEQSFRYNNRTTSDNPLTDSDRFALAVTQIVGKRLTYSELTGKDLKKPELN